ncbi:hypothetical protein FJZ33_00425 [Candidatus Poribacteria bacterium]|nr:hypothetical protein [Candidatus Poribacteria bacterium]
MNQSSEYEWHEFPWDRVPEMPPGPYKKLKIYADANIPGPIINALRAAGFSVESAAETGYSTHPDENIYQLAKKRGKVLLTMDKDFWYDRKYSLQNGPGVILVNISPDQLEKAIDGLARFCALVGDCYPLDWWQVTKARVTENSFIVKRRMVEGRIVEDEFCLNEDGKLLTRRLK